MVSVPYFFFISSAAGFGRVDRLLNRLRIGHVLDPMRASFSLSVRGRASVLATASLAASSKPAPVEPFRNPRRLFMATLYPPVVQAKAARTPQWNRRAVDRPPHGRPRKSRRTACRP